MSVDYASKLSYYPNKGVCGVPEVFDDDAQLNVKLNELANLFRHSTYIVVHTGAGISTSVGIPDFRGPNGVWTLEKIGKKPKLSVPFEKAVPSLAHRALVELERHDLIKFLVTQNIDGLHLRSGFPRDRLAILHGDIFLESCPACGTAYARLTPSQSMGLRQSSVTCNYLKPNNRYCRKADLHICIGSSLQIFPAASFPLINACKTVKGGSTNDIQTDHKNNDSTHNLNSKLVIINLQPTKMAKYATLNINAPADLVMKILCEKLDIVVPPIPPPVDSLYSPTIVLRSVHSRLEIPSPWRILPHPTNKYTIQIIQTNNQHMESKIKKDEKMSCLHSAFDSNESHCIIPPTFNLQSFTLGYLRIAFVLTSGYLHPDEYFQSIEVAAGDIYNLDVLRTWEFHLVDKGPLRSVAGMLPFVHIPIQVAKWIYDWLNSETTKTDFSGSDMLDRVVFPSRLITVLGSCLIDIFILRFSIHHDRHHQLFVNTNKIRSMLHIVLYFPVPTALLLYASCAFGGSLWSTRTIVNVWESIYVSLFGLLFLQILNRLEQSPNLATTKHFIIVFVCIQSAIVVWGSFLRPTYALFIFPLGCIELAFIFIKLKYVFIILCLPAVLFVVFLNTLLCVIIDTLYFHNVNVLQIFKTDFSRFQLICTPCRFFTYNTNSHYVSSHGLHSRFTHFLINWPLILGPIFTVHLFFQSLRRRSLLLFVSWICVTFPTLILSIIPHQEARFLIPCLPFACYIIGRSIDAKLKRAKGKEVSYILTMSAILWIFHQFILMLFYGYLHQAGLLSYMKTIPISVNECITHVFFRTYMPPRFPLDIPLNKSHPSQSCKSLIDLGGSNFTVLNHTINHLKTYQNFSGILKLVYPGSLFPLQNLPLSSWGDVITAEQYFPHLSMENLPSIQYPFVYENWRSQLSLHVLTIKWECLCLTYVWLPLCIMYTPSKEPNTFRMTIDKHSVFETSNPLSESVNNLPGTAFESRILSHLQNGGLFHSSKLLPKLTPSPDIKNRFHLSSINNKPLVLSVTSSRFQSDALSTTPPLDSSKSVTADDFTGFWPPSIPPSNHIINQKNDNPLIIQSDEYVPTSISSNQPACCIPTSILSDQTTFKTLVTSIRSPVNHVSVAIFPVLPTHITSSPFRPPLCFIPESVKTAVSNRTFCFVNSSNIDKSPGVCIRSTLVSRKDQPNIVAPASSCDEAETHSHLTLFAKSENISLTPISTLHSLFNETNHLEESCLDTIDIDSTPPKIIQQDELPSLKKLLSCDNCPYTSSNPNRLSRYINSRHLFFPDRDKSKSPYLPIHLASSSDISNEIIVTSLCSTSSSLLPVNIPSSLSITVSTSSLPIDISTSQLPVTNCSPSDSFGTTVFSKLINQLFIENCIKPYLIKNSSLQKYFY
ncbi:NAD-dependent protein deacetylase SRT1 [Schistosoma japonicum]|nr:NAD-dependent protein deacetylase SRT1 [Schistosoma japonicum]